MTQCINPSLIKGSKLVEPVTIQYRILYDADLSPIYDLEKKNNIFLYHWGEEIDPWTGKLNICLYDNWGTEDEPDYGDRYFYKGVATYDDMYDYWRKYEVDGDMTLDSVINSVYIYTNRIVVDSPEFELVKYCPTMKHVWDAIADSGVWPPNTSAENFWALMIGPDEEYETISPYPHGTYTSPDGLSIRHALCLGSGNKWPYNINKITGSTWRDIVTTSGYNILLTPTKYYGSFPGVASNPDLMCTYLPMDSSTIYSGYLYFPIMKMGGENPSQIIQVPRQYISVSKDCPIIVFWRRFQVDGVDYIGPGWVVRFPSSTSTSPTITKFANLEEYVKPL